MPLNTADSDERRTPSGRETEFPRPPERDAPGRKRRILFWIFLAVAFVSAIFLLIEFGLLPPGGMPEDQAPAGGDSAASAPQTDASAPASGPTDGKDRAAELRKRLSQFAGEYTIFIGALRDSVDAAELAGRWERAGYPALVRHASGWYRVGLGRYATADLARQEAEKLRQAFEDGYWIGRAAL